MNVWVKVTSKKGQRDISNATLEFPFLELRKEKKKKGKPKLGKNQEKNLQHISVL
jgi:hypothetical protein